MLKSGYQFSNLRMSSPKVPSQCIRFDIELSGEGKILNIHIVILMAFDVGERSRPTNQFHRLLNFVPDIPVRFQGGIWPDLVVGKIRYYRIQDPSVVGTV